MSLSIRALFNQEVRQFQVEKITLDNLYLCPRMIVPTENNDTTFLAILSEMINHFMSGSGTDYSNSNLTNAVKNHPNTQNYVTTYSGTLKFTFYDHFGLDTPGLSEEKYGDLVAGIIADSGNGIFCNIGTS